MIAASCLIAACGTAAQTTTSGPSGVVEGTVLAGPTCPVVSQPPDPSCADRPVAGAVLRILDDQGSIAAEVTSDEEGRFRAELEPGRYSLVPQPVEGLLGTASAQTFTISEAAVVTLLVGYDTGIR